jgi:hypothetical protein
MSRRAIFFVLATSAALIATQATADPECFSDACHVPEVAEPPVAAAQLPEVVDAPDVEARAAAQMPEPAKALPQVVTPYTAPHMTRHEARQETRPADLPKVIAVPTPVATVTPIRVAESAAPDVQAPAPVVAEVEEVRAPRKPSKVVERPAVAPRPAVAQRPATVPRAAPSEPVREYVAAVEPAQAVAMRSARVLSAEPVYTVTPAAALAGAVVVVVPGAVHAGYRGVPGYLIAPGAKIIAIDSDD